MPAAVITALMCIIYVSAVLGQELVYINYSSLTEYPAEPPLLAVVVMLIGLCVFVPVLMFWFKTNVRQSDCFFSLGIRREKLYLVRSAVGLLMVIVPFTVTYWLGFIAVACRYNLFNLVMYVPAYFLAVLFAVVIY